MQISSAKKAQEITELQHQLRSSTFLIEEIKVQKEESSLSLLQKLEAENEALKNQILEFDKKMMLKQTDTDKLKELQETNVTLNATITTFKVTQQQYEQELETLRQENKMLRQTMSNDQHREQENVSKMVNRIQELEDSNRMLQAECQQLQASDKEIMMKYQDLQKRMAAMNKCSFNMFKLCRNMRRNISDTETDINIQQNNIKMEYQDYLQQVNTKCMQYALAQVQIENLKSEQKQHELNTEQLRNNLKNVKATRQSLNSLRTDVETELINFDKDIKSVQKSIFKQKSNMMEQMKQEQDKSAKLMENEQNLEQRLNDYLKQKQELENKINSLEGFLKEKNEKDLVTEMKRFRTAAIVTSVTSLPEDGGQGLSYHKLSEHERKAISLKSRVEKRMNIEINISEKVDEFVKSGGLKRYPILEQEFVYQPTQTENNRFRFGTKYVNIWYNTKRNELYVVENEKASQALSEWLSKNAPIEMRKLLAKVAKKKRTRSSEMSQQHV